MVGFFKLKSDALADQVATGEAIMRVSKSAFKDTATSEWKKFNDDTRGWLHANGYRYDGPGAGPKVQGDVVGVGLRRRGDPGLVWAEEGDRRCRCLRPGCRGRRGGTDTGRAEHGGAPGEETPPAQRQSSRG